MSLSVTLTRKSQPSTPTQPKEWVAASLKLTCQQIMPWTHPRMLVLVSIFLFFICKALKLLFVCFFIKLWCSMRFVITHDSSGIASCLHYSVIQRTESAGWLMQCFVLFVLWDKHLAESSFWKLDCSFPDKAASLAAFLTGSLGLARCGTFFFVIAVVWRVLALFLPPIAMNAHVELAVRFTVACNKI